MMKYLISIKEILEKTILVEGESLIDAIDKVEKAHDDSQIIVVSVRGVEPEERRLDLYNKLEDFS